MNSLATANLIQQATAQAAAVPKSLYLEHSAGATAVDIDSDIWALTSGGSVAAGARIAEGDTVYCIGSQCRLRVSSDSPRFVLRHNNWVDSTASYGRFYIDDNVTLSLGDGTDAIIDDGTSPMYINNVGEDSNVGTGSTVKFYGNVDMGGGATVVQNIDHPKLGGTPGVQVTYLCDYISPEGDPDDDCTVIARTDVVVDYSLKNHAIGNNTHTTRFTVESNAEINGSNLASVDIPAGKVLSISGAGTWGLRMNLTGYGGEVDVTGLTGTFNADVVELDGTNPKFTNGALQEFYSTQFSVKSPITLQADLRCKNFAVTGDGQVDCDGHTAYLVSAGTGTVLSGATSEDQSILNTSSNPVTISSSTGSGTLTVRGTKSRGGGTDGVEYFGHLKQTGGATLYLRDSNPSFSTLEVAGVLRVQGNTIPTLDGELTMLSGSIFFSAANNSDWTNEGFLAETVDMQGGQELRNAVITLDTAGTADSTCEFEGCDFSGGAALVATGATDSGGNTNITF